MTNNNIKFGTDGWRGIIAQDFTFDNVRICAQGLADYLKQTGLAKQGLLIGYDTRFASEDFASASAEVLAGNGIKVYLCSKAAPTPQISFGVASKKVGGAIIITASHNPAKWNGFKVKSEDGASAPTELINKLENNISQIINKGKVNKIPLAEAITKKQVEYIDIDSIYFDHLSQFINMDRLRNSGLNIVIDSMYGAGSGYFKELLSGGNNQLLEINGERNPSFPGIQPEPIAANLNNLSDRVIKGKASVGIATDGDADRIGIIDENGVFLTQLQVHALLALYMLEIRGDRGAIVKTITTTGMLDRLGELYKVPVYETPVGFKYVAPMMIKENALIGGEESGGYGFRGHVPERDALLAGLYFLDFMVRTGKTPSELLQDLYKKVGQHHYKRVDIEFPAEERELIINRLEKDTPDTIDGIEVLRKDTFDGFRYVLFDNTWLLIRFSGTEPILRIYTETDSLTRADKMLDIGKELAGI